MPARPPVRVGLNLLYLRPGIVGGTETYARGLVDGLAAVAPERHFVVFVNRDAGHWTLPPRFERVVCPVGSRQGLRYLYEQLVLPIQLQRHEIELVHSLAYVAPMVTPCASVVTVHDLNYRAPSHRMRGIRRLALGAFVTGAIRSSDAVVLVSRFIRDELATLMPAMATKLRVVHEAPMPRGGAAPSGEDSWGPRAPYFLAFSSVSPNKNLARLLQAFAIARSAGLREQLLLVGHRPAWAVDGAPGVVWAGYVSDDRIVALLRAATALLYPSLYEGFGLPVLEAMQQGTPVACSRCASLPEVAGDAALYFDAERVESIADAMQRLATEPQLRLGLATRGRSRAAQFTWRRAAEATLAVYDSAVQARAAAAPWGRAGG